MSTEPSENQLTAWWLEIAPSRQEELLEVPLPPLPWLAESLSGAGLDIADLHRFLDIKRGELEPTRDAGLNPKPD